MTFCLSLNRFFLISEKESSTRDLINLSAADLVQGGRRRLQEQMFEYKGNYYSINISGGDNYTINTTKCYEKIAKNLGLNDISDVVFYFYQFNEASIALKFVQEGHMKITNQNNFLLFAKADVKNKPFNINKSCNPKDIIVRFETSYKQQISAKTVEELEETEGVNVFETNDPFFYDRCRTYAKDGKDQVVSEREKFRVKNDSVCQETENQICKVIDFDFNNDAKCSCSGIGDFDKKDIIIQALSFDNFNYEVVVCWNETFKNKFYMNIGFWTMISIILLFAIWTILSFNQSKDLIYGPKILSIIRNDCSLYDETIPIKTYLRKIEYVIEPSIDEIQENDEAGSGEQKEESKLSESKNEKKINENKSSEIEKDSLNVSSNNQNINSDNLKSNNKENARDERINSEEKMYQVKVEEVFLEIPNKANDQKEKSKLKAFKENNEDSKEKGKINQENWQNINFEDFKGKEVIHLASLKKLNNFKDENSNGSIRKSKVTIHNADSNNDKDAALKTNKIIGLTLKDIGKLSVEDTKKYDNRSFKEFLIDTLMHKHDQGPLAFMDSLINPSVVRILVLMTAFSLKFFTNAFFYQDQEIVKMNEAESTLLFTITIGIWKSVLSALAAGILTVIFYAMLYIPEEYKNDLITAMKTLNRDTIHDA